jgi:hypothetical protein
VPSAPEHASLVRGTRHAFANEGSQSVRAHVFCSPGGLERFFRAVATADDDEAVDAGAERAGLAFG